MGWKTSLVRGLIRYGERKAIKYAGLRNSYGIGKGSIVQDIGNILDYAPQFDENSWESGCQDILNAAVDKAGNAGQETLIQDYFEPKALEYCRLAQQDFDSADFIEKMGNELGDTYYYAINEIIAETADQLDELRDSCDQSFMENVMFNKFGHIAGFTYLYRNTNNRMYGNMNSAIQAYSQAAVRNGYKTGDSSYASKYNLEKNRQSLISRFGSGRTIPWRSSSGMENVPGYAAYQAAAKRNGKIINP